MLAGHSRLRAICAPNMQLHISLIALVVLKTSPDSLGVTAGLDHSKGFRAAPVPEVELIVGSD